MPRRQATSANRLPPKPERARKLDHSKVEQSTGYLIRKTFRAFTRALEHRLAPYEVSLSMWFFLRLLWEQDGRTQKELSHELGLTQATTVAAMDVMASRGLIQRHRSTEDRRRMHIFLTKEGRALKERLLPYAAEVNRTALQNIAPAQLEQLWDLLGRINHSLSEDHERFVAQSALAQQHARAKRSGG